MPLYEFQCPKCGSRYEEIFGPNDEKSYKCPTCNVKTNRLYSTFRTIVDFRSGWDPGLGEYVDTKRQREGFLREKGLYRDDKPDDGRWV